MPYPGLVIAAWPDYSGRMANGNITQPEFAWPYIHTGSAQNPVPSSSLWQWMTWSENRRASIQVVLAVDTYRTQNHGNRAPHDFAEEH